MCSNILIAVTDFMQNMFLSYSTVLRKERIREKHSDLSKESIGLVVWSKIHPPYRIYKYLIVRRTFHSPHIILAGLRLVYLGYYMQIIWVWYFIWDLSDALWFQFSIGWGNGGACVGGNYTRWLKQLENKVPTWSWLLRSLVQIPSDGSQKSVSSQSAHGASEHFPPKQPLAKEEQSLFSSQSK